VEERFALGIEARHLWTRELAKRIRAKVNLAIEKLDAGDVLVIDAKDVEAFDFSFANEFFGKTVLGLPHESPGRFVVVEHLTNYTRENLAQALSSLGLAMIERKRGGTDLIGKFHPADNETFQALVGLKNGASAVELSKQLGTNLTAMNERLTKLMSMGLARRIKVVSPVGREQFQYTALR